MAARVTAAESIGTREDGIERRARGFAPSFLAPRAQVRQWASLQRLGDARKTAMRLAEEWGLSFEGAAWHAKNCGLVAPHEADRLVRDARPVALPHEAFETEDAGFPPSMIQEGLPERPAALMDGWATGIVVQALERQVISKGRARELLLWG